MPPPSPTADELARLAALDNLQVLDTAEEAEFDALTRAAALICGAPISLISLVDKRRQWFKAGIGLPNVRETPREIAFCDHVIRGVDLMEVPDAACDDRFSTNPLVTGAPNIRFYAGVPLMLTTGLRVGTLCVIDYVPRELNAQQRQLLRLLAEVTVGALEARRAILGERARREQTARDVAHRRQPLPIGPTGTSPNDLYGHLISAPVC